MRSARDFCVGRNIGRKEERERHAAATKLAIRAVEVITSTTYGPNGEVNTRKKVGVWFNRDLDVQDGIHFELKCVDKGPVTVWGVFHPVSLYYQFEVNKVNEFIKSLWEEVGK